MLTLLLAIASLASEHPSQPHLSPLPQLAIDPVRITSSGVSSGAYFSTQFHVAHSALVKGSASIAGGTYWCAEGNAGRSQSHCMFTATQVNPERGIQRAKEEAAAHRIDPLENLLAGRAFVFAGEKDFIINAGHSEHLARFYSAFLPSDSIRKVRHPSAAHGFPTNGFGNPCGQMGSPWLLNCQSDLAGDFLRFLDPKAADRAPSAPGSFLYFDQRPFTPAASSYLYPWGALYVPAACAKGARCGLHLAFHGCQMNPDFIERQFIEKAGYVAHADRLETVVLFPQSAKGQGNPYGCWDWFGLTGSDYVNQNGPQVKAVREMVRAISGF